MTEATLPSDTPSHLDALVRGKHVVVCCGAGGVGKTTTSAAIGLAAARAGRRVLVLTIDPARRLAEAMGIPESAESPSRVPADRLAAAGVTTGSLDAWMLDPRIVIENMVVRLSPDRAAADRMLNNRIYLRLSRLIAGVQEYAAAEALFVFATSGRYDVVVLDTPPSRNALDFLEAPNRLISFLDERVISIFLPGASAGQGIFMRKATELVNSVFSRVFGEVFFSEIQEFLSVFSGLFAAMKAHTEQLQALLRSEDSAFVLVTSPEAAALEEATFFRNQIQAMGLPFAGFVLNRSWAYTRGFSPPEAIELPEDAPAAARTAHAKLVALAGQETQRAHRDRGLLARLREQIPGGFAVATPNFGDAIEDLAGLTELAAAFARGHG